MCKVGDKEHGLDVLHRRRHLIIVYNPDTGLPVEIRAEGYHVYPDGHTSMTQTVVYSYTPGAGKRSLGNVEALLPESDIKRKPFGESLWLAWERADTSIDPAKPMS